MKCAHCGAVCCEAVCSAGGEHRLAETATSSESLRAPAGKLYGIHHYCVQ